MTKLLKFPLLSSIILAIAISGCGLYNTKPVETTKVEAVLSDVDSQIVAALNKADRNDCHTIYCIFSGCALYVERAGKTKTTLDMLKLLGEVEKDYGWATEKYPELTNAIEDDLKSKGYEGPKDIDDTTKAEVVKIFKGYATSVKRAALKKAI